MRERIDGRRAAAARFRENARALVGKTAPGADWHGRLGEKVGLCRQKFLDKALGCANYCNHHKAAAIDDRITGTPFLLLLKGNVSRCANSVGHASCFA